MALINNNTFGQGEKFNDFKLLETESTIIRKHRECLGMTQQQVANEIGITVRQYQRYESGEKSIYSASFQIGVRLFKILRLEINEFFGFRLEG